MDANPGPIDGSILYDQDKHVSAAVWDGQERGALRCHEHTSKLGEWRLTAKQIELVEKAGFGYLRKIPAISLDNPLISALVERWRRETNTFHFSVGEMTVTLQDVALLLGLSIDGRPVIGITYTTCSSVCERLLGKAPDSRYASGGMVKLSWLKEFFSHCPDNAPTEEVERCTRAYLLYLVGSTIFSTTTGNKVPVMYLPLFENFQEAGNFAWGAAALAFLYRALGNACVKSQSTICGCLTLLQCWSYFHLNIGRPKLNRDPIHDHFPFVLRWKGKQSGPTTNRDVVFYRKALDSLKPSDVEWLPYKYMDSTVIPERIKDTLILGRSKTMLMCFDKAERHLPDRCLRQYGMLQPIPEDVVRWVRKSRGVDGGVDLSGKMESELNEWSDRRLYIVDGDDGVDEMEYMQWYSRISRKVVGRPISLSSEFQRTISGLREIAYLAESFSTKGLDGQQFESITRIRFIAQDCLKDQAGSPVTPSATPLIEPGKRSRGKERIRRKGSIKRRRKDDTMEYYEGSEDDQSQVYGTVIEVDQLQLRQDDIRELQLHEADDEVDPQHLFLSPDEDNIAELHVVVNKADDAHLINTSDDNKSQSCNATNNNVKESQVCGATMEEVDDSEAYDHTNEVIAFQSCQATVNEVHGSNPGDSTSKANDQEMHDATINEANELSHPSKEARDTHIPDATKDPEDMLLPDATEDGNGSQLPEATVADKDLQLPGATEEANGSQLYDAAISVKELQLPDATEEENGSQLPGATIPGQNLQLLDATEEENGSRLSDAANGSQLSGAAIAGKDLRIPDASGEENALQLHDAAIAVNGSQLPDAIEAENGSQLPDKAFAGKDIQLPDATEEENNSRLHQETIAGEDLQPPDATKEENGSQLHDVAVAGKGLQIPDAIEEGNVSQLPDAAITGKVSLLPGVIEEGNCSQLPDAAMADKVSHLPDAIEESSSSRLPHGAIKDKGSPPHDPTKKVSVSQLPEATEKGKGSQLQDSAEEPKDLQLQEAAETGKELQHPDTTDCGKDSQFSDSTEDKDLHLQNVIKEGKASQLSDTIEEGDLQPLKTTIETNESHPPDATNEAIDSKFSHSADGTDSSAAKAPNDVPGEVIE